MSGAENEVGLAKGEAQTQVDRWHLEHVAKQKWDGVIGDG